jgi:hypothetical protein
LRLAQEAETLVAEALCEARREHRS